MKKILFFLLIPFVASANEYSFDKPSEYGFKSVEYVKVTDEYKVPTPKPDPVPSIVVNKTDYTLRVILEDETIVEHRVIVGRTGRETPTLNSKFSRIILNPVWRVPNMLLGDLIAIIKSKRDPISYINEMGFRIYRDEVEQDPEMIDWPSIPSSGPYDFIIEQDPGPDNMIGQVLFVLQETGEIQMHDTPNKSLFDKKIREFSAGCIRVDDAIGLATRMLKKTPEEVKELLDNGKKIAFDLTTPINITVVD